MPCPPEEHQTPRCLQKLAGPAIPWFGGTGDSSTCTGGTFVADPGVCPCSWDLYLRGRKLNNRVYDAPGELLPLNPLFPAVSVTDEASKTPPLTSSNTVRNLKQLENQSKAKQKNQKKREKEEKPDGGLGSWRNPQTASPVLGCLLSSRLPGPVRRKQFVL